MPDNPDRRNHETPFDESERDVDLPLFDEEFSEPLVPPVDQEIPTEDPREEIYFQSTSFIGWISLILSFVGLFTMPVLFASAGIIFGFIARNRDAEWLGNIAIVLGIIAIISAFFIRPFM